MKLYSYWRSTTSVRVRAALNLKGVAHEIVPLDLVGGEHRGDAYAAINPSKGVPALVLDDGTVLTQSLAIIDYLDATWPEPPMLPGDDIDRAKVLAASLCIAMDIHPVNNLVVLNRLKSRHGLTQEDTVDWMHHWMHEGLTAFQALIRDDTRYTFGDTVTLADLCLVGQMVNARRWGLDLAPFGRLVEVDTALCEIEAIRKALPEQQPDAA